MCILGDGDVPGGNEASENIEQNKVCYNHYPDFFFLSNKQLSTAYKKGLDEKKKFKQHRLTYSHPLRNNVSANMKVTRR